MQKGALKIYILAAGKREPEMNIFRSLAIEVEII